MGNLQLLISKRRRDIPLRVSLAYAFFSTLWIVFSDRLLLALVDDIEILTFIQTLKGWLFIAITTLLIFHLLRREIRKVRKLEEQLIQSEKMVSISQLATGVANQINNPLAGIVQNAQIIRNRLSEEKKANQKAADELGINLGKVVAYAEKRELGRIVNSIVSSGREASELIENMLSFSSSGSNKKVYQDPAALIDNTLELLKKDSRFQAIDFFREYKETRQVYCEPNRMKHVFFHIFTNCMEAVPEGDAAAIHIRLRNVGKNVEIQIEDSGCGMNDKVRSRVFEPFFTTKEGAKGLGMAISNYIISEIHGGFIGVSSREGRGSSFTIRLPAHD